MLVRTRFAPSPTGYLHLGGARTALYAWLYARKNQGKFILRIEDTDRERSTEDAIRAIFEGMRWLGLDWDEGPFYQTERFGRYAQAMNKLLDEDKAYRCYCSKERLDALRQRQLDEKQKPRYDGFCRDKQWPHRDEPYVVRFKNPEQGEVVVQDQVYGHVVFQNSELDDLIIRRSDGTPTYNFCVVVDDWDMQITHVIRGDDHLNNTPRQMNILQALGAVPPVYAHVPMILGADGKKLSKRHGAVSVTEYREQGFLPEAMKNYLVRLGWSYGDQEIFSQEQMIALFDMSALNKSAAAFNPEKLLWLNQHYIKTLPPVVLAPQLSWLMHRLGIPVNKGPELEKLIDALKERAKDLREMAEKNRYFYEDILRYDEKAALQHLTPETSQILEAAYQQLRSLAAWDEASIHQAIQQIMQQLQVKMAQVAQPIRVAVTGNTLSPSIDVTLALLGKERTLRRISDAMEFIKTSMVE